MKGRYLYISMLCLLMGCASIRNRFATPITWIPKHSYLLETPEDLAAVLTDKIPLKLSISFDTVWNNANKPAPLDAWEDYGVEEDVIDFLVKDIQIEGGKGSLFLCDGGADGVIGKPFVSGIKLKHGITHLYYVPDPRSECHAHTIHISSIILTKDYGREAGKPVTCSIKLMEPEYTATVQVNDGVVYIEDKHIPVTVGIASDNPLAAHQHYILHSWSIQNGKGSLWRKTKSSVKPVYPGIPIQYGTNELFYAPESANHEEHTIHLTIGNAHSHARKELSFSLHVADHRIEPFRATLSKQVTHETILPFRNTHLRLSIEPETESGRTLNYRVKSIKMAAGKLLLDGKIVVDGTELKVGNNPVVFNPEGRLGDVDLSMVVVNSKGDEFVVSFADPLEVCDPKFRVESVIVRESINLKVTSPNHSSSDKWSISKLTLLGGIEGRLLHPNGDVVGPNSSLQIGNNYFVFELGNTERLLDTINGLPKIDIEITYPDGKTVSNKLVDLSSFLVPSIAAQIESLAVQSKTLYVPLLQDYSHYPNEPLQALKSRKGNWYHQSARLKKVLSFIQHGTNGSTQANEALCKLTSLEETTRKWVHTRVATTKLLYDWYKELIRIQSTKNQKTAIALVNALDKQMHDAAHIFQSCSAIAEMADVAPALECITHLVQTEKERKNVTVETIVEHERINLKVTPSNHSTTDHWLIANLTLVGGIQGRLLTPAGASVGVGNHLAIGDNYFSFELDNLAQFLDKLHGAPKITLDITYPDGRTHLIHHIDLSTFLIEALTPKMEALKMESQELFSPILQNYRHEPAGPLQAFAKTNKKWCKKQAKIKQVLCCMQQDTVVVNQANAAMDSIENLSEVTKNKVDKRKETTELLCGWYQKLSMINHIQDSKTCESALDALKESVSGYTDLFQSCSNIQGLTDVTEAYEALLIDIEEEIRHTNYKRLIEDAAENTRRSELDLIRNRIQEEETARIDGFRGLRTTIDSESSARASAISRLDSRIDAASTSNSSEIRRLEGRISAEERARENAIDTLHEEISKLKRQQETLSSQLKANSSNIANLNNLKYELERVRQQLSRAEQKMSSLTSDLYALNNRVNNNTKWWSFNKTGSIQTKN